MTRLTVIEGGKATGERQVLWNRAPLGKATAMVLRRDDIDPRRLNICLDDGGQHLIGVLSVTPGDPRIAAWLDWAKGEDVPVIDERPTERVMLADGAADQALIPGVEPVSHTARAIAVHQAMRDAKRLNLAPPAGGLFDAVERKQQDLF